MRQRLTGDLLVVALALVACTMNGTNMPSFDEIDQRTQQLVIDAMDSTGIRDRFAAATSSGNISPCGTGDDPGDPVQVRYVVLAPVGDDAAELARAAVAPWREAGAEIVDEPTGPQLVAFTGTVEGFTLSAVALSDQVGLRVESPCTPLPDDRRVGVPSSPVLPSG